MSFYGILLNLNKFYTIYRVLMDLSNALNTPYFLLGFILTWFFLVFVFSKLRKKTKPAADTKIETDAKFSRKDFESSFRKHKCLLKRISDKMAEDRKCLEKTLGREQLSFRGRLSEAGAVSRLLDSICEVLKRKEDTRRQDAEDIEGDLTALQSDVSEIRGQLEGGPTTLSENNFSQKEKVFTPELLDGIAAASRDAVSEIGSEAVAKEGQIIRRISQFLEQSQRDIQRELDVFSSAAERGEKDRGGRSGNASVLSRVKTLEKRLQDTLAVLGRQRFETENLPKILHRFGQRFDQVATRFDARFKQKKSAYDCSRRAFSSVSRRVDDSSGRLVDQSRHLSAVVAEMRHLLSAAGGGPDGFFSLGLQLDIERRFEDMASMVEKTKDQLSIIAQSSDDLRVFQGLVTRLSDGYDALFKMFPPSSSLSDEAGFLFRSGRQHCGGIPAIRGDEATNDDDVVRGRAKDQLERRGRGDTDVERMAWVPKDATTSASYRPSHENAAKDGSTRERKIKGMDLLESTQNEHLLCDETGSCLIHLSDDSETESMVTCAEMDRA